MKAATLFIFTLIVSLNIFAQNSNSIWTFHIGESKYAIGGYLGTNLKYSTFESNPAGYVDLKGAFTINSNWAIGFSATGLYYDKKLSGLVNDGTYHISAGYTGLFIERLFPITDNTYVTISVLTGQGEAYYQYDKEYRESRPWYQEIIDKEKFYVFEPSAEIMQRINGNFFLGLTGSYRFTSPVELAGTSSSILKTLSGGLSIKYGLF